MFAMRPNSRTALRVCSDVAGIFPGHSRIHCVQIQRMLHRPFRWTRRELRTAVARLAALHLCKGMVSNQNTGFPISESRQRFHSSERIKLRAQYAEYNALNGHS